jgi:hypothetical protein
VFVERRARFTIVGFDGEDNIEFFRRVIRYYGANATSLTA